MEEVKFVCTPGEFLAATPRERRQLVRDQLDLTPEHWSQEMWVEFAELDDEQAVEDINKRNICGTAFCFAGWACFLAGDKFVNDEDVKLRNGHMRHISDRAARLLGLKNEGLFAPDNTLDDLDEMLERLGQRS